MQVRWAIFVLWATHSLAALPVHAQAFMDEVLVSQVTGAALMANGDAFAAGADVPLAPAASAGDPAAIDETLPGLDRPWDEVLAEEGILDDDPGLVADGTDNTAEAAAIASAALGAGSFATATTTPILDLKYSYDADLNIVGEGRLFNVPSNKTHTINGLSRLAQTRTVLGTSPAVTEVFGYTPAGFLGSAGNQKYTRVSQTASAEAVGSITNATSGAVLRTLTYDTDGMVRTDVDATGARTLSFDGLACLSQQTRPGVSVTRICGPEGGEQFRSTTSGAVTKRKVDLFGLAELRPDDARLAVRLSVNGTALVEEVYNTTLARVEAESIVQHADVRGSVLMTSVNGAPLTITGDVEYDPWGATIATGVGVPRHRFVDTEPDLFGGYVFGKRVYSPTLRRWLSPDPLVLLNPGMDAADGGQLDLYGYAANNPVRVTDRNGTIGTDAQFDRSVAGRIDGNAVAAASAGSTGLDPATAVSLGAGAIPYVGDYVSLGISAGELIVDPSAGNAVGVGLDAIGAALPFVPALGTMLKALPGRTVEDMALRALPANAGPVAHISPSEVLNKTPTEIDDAARRLGLQPKGPDPMGGKGSYVDPQTGQQRILSHPNDPTGAHGHVNDPAGKRIGAQGKNVKPEEPAAHLPINKP